MRTVLRFLIGYVAALALLAPPAFGQVSVDTAKTRTGLSAVLLGASASAVILPSSGSSNAAGQITMTTALPATPAGTIGLYLPAGVVTAGTQGTGAGVYQATCSSTTVCTLTGTVTTANAAYTQSTNEVVLVTTTVPAGSMGLNGAVEIRTTWTYPSSANAKTPRIRFGGAAGTQYLNPALTTTTQFPDARRIRNRGSAALQVGSAGANVGPFGAGTATVPTSAVDTTASADVVISAQLALATEFMILECREVWLLP